MKRQLLLSLLLVLCVAFDANAQSTHTSSLMFRNHTELATPDLAFNSSSQFQSNMTQAGLESYADRDRESRRYESAQHKRTAGIALTAIGASCLAGGATLLAFGVPGFNNDLNGGGTAFSPFQHVGEVVGGILLSAVGLGLTIPGAIMIAKGNHNMKKYRASQVVTPL